MNTNIYQQLEQRGLIAQYTDKQELITKLDKPITLYCGFDPTADSLHIGSLVPILLLRRFQNAGHKVIVLVGGSTGLIGDPSFKSEERKLAGIDIVTNYSNKLQQQLSHFLDFAGNNPAIVVNNYAWTKNISALDFLRDYGKHFTINNMVAKESVKQRLDREDQGISYTEFSYSILQALDFYFLNKQHNCELQIGGKDQWGNIVAGINLTRRKANKKTYALTTPLITKADGSKFGKTEQGTVWLSAAKTSPYSFYQFWLNTADADVYKFLKYFTFLSCEQIEAIANKDKQLSGRPEAGRILAEQVTELVHGKTALTAAQSISQYLFNGEIEKIAKAEWRQLQQDGMPSSSLDLTETTDATLSQLLVNLEVVKSGKQVKDALANGGLKVNNTVLTPAANTNLIEIFSREKAFFDKYFMLKIGKKNNHLFVI